jgi:glycosyltransferase involved in cell wall biosynthesis
MTVVHVLGTHGVPAAYGGFETAAQEVGLFLRDRGWDVIVYCQLPGEGPTTQDQWHGLTRVNIHEPREGWRGTAAFDLTCVRHVLAHAGPDDVCLTFGYNTGIFNVAQRVRGIPTVINMDGMEWTRRRWGLVRQGILLGNERMAGLVGDVLIADHPVISDYLRRHFGSSRVATITYGAHTVDDAPTGPVDELGLTPGDFATMVCRPIPENSCLEIVRAWSRRPRGLPLVVLGDYQPDDAYHRAVQAAAGDEVRFLGAVHDPVVVGSLRRHSRVYLHGHTVGGTNPSLVEAMAAGNGVVARRNVYNTWVAGDGALYFSDEDELDAQLGTALDPAEARRLGKLARERFEGEFTWERIGAQYEEALLRAMARRGRRREARTPR